MQNINFEELGLTKNESKVYQTLVEFGKMSSTQVSSKSGAPYGRIYDVLGSLIKKGLVRVIPDKTKKFIASSPQELIKTIEEKEKKLTEMKERAHQLKTTYDQKEKDVVEVAHGDKGFWKLNDSLKKQEDYVYNIKWVSQVRPENLISRKKYIKKGVDIKELVRYDDETKSNVHKWLKISPHMRKIENDGVAMSIIDDSEVMVGLIKSNTTLLIRDAHFAKVMKKLFLETYKHAKEIKKS